MTDSNAAPPPAQPDDAGSSSSGSSSLPAAAAPKKLTAKQQAVFDLKMAGKTRTDASAILGISPAVYSKTLQAAYRKLGWKKGERPNTNTVEYRQPEKAAAIIDALSDPLNKVKEALVAAGLPERVGEAVLKRLRVKFFGAVQEVRALKTQEIVRTIEEKIDMIRFYLDDKVMAEASARDLMLGLGVLVEKRALLRGEPTQIVSDHERAKIHELVPALLKEAQRRGLTLEGQVTEKIIGPA